MGPGTGRGSQGRAQAALQGLVGAFGQANRTVTQQHFVAVQDGLKSRGADPTPHSNCYDSTGQPSSDMKRRDRVVHQGQDSVGATRIGPGCLASDSRYGAVVSSSKNIKVKMRLKTRQGNSESATGENWQRVVEVKSSTVVLVRAQPVKTRASRRRWAQDELSPRVE